MSDTSQKRAIQFLLVPDASAGRRLRRLLATTRARSGVAVGTWHDLLSRARDAYFIPAPAADEAEFEQALARVDKAFWRESLGAAPTETTRALHGEFVDVVSASDPKTALADLEVSALADRPRRIIGDLKLLYRQLEACLPADLEVIRRLLQVDSEQACQPLCVHRVKELPHTSRWQDALIDRLNADAAMAGATPDEELSQTLQACLQERRSAASDSALGILQRRLFEPEAVTAAVDGTTQWVRVRDFYQEAETAAGMAQQLLAADPALSPQSIGLLVPDSFEYSVALEDAFGLGGLPLSGLVSERWQRDLGNEAVFHFLFCRQKPAPAMALAVCFSSRLMPWPAEDGAQMAQAVMDGDYEPRLPSRRGKPAERMRDLLLGGDTEPSTLAEALADFASLLDGGDRFAAHAQRAREGVERVRGELAGARALDWTSLRRAVNPTLISAGASPNHNLEGITVWRESDEPWRPVQHLFVLGFSHGHYPRRLGTSAVLAEPDRREIRNKLGLRLESRAERQSRLRRLFRRQLGAVSGTATFFVPHRSPDGTIEAASDSLAFIERLLSPPGTADRLVATLDSATDRGRIRHVAHAESCAPTPPRELYSAELRFGRDLLALRTDKAGNLRPESPSSLETLLVSPLAWLLRRVQAEPLQWAPEAADPAVLGNLAHGVFEDLFPSGRGLLKDEEIGGRVASALEGRIQQHAPFFRSPHWRIERRELAAGTARAAKAWRRVLDELGATVLGNEQWFRGEALDIPVVGKADLVLGIGNDHALIVDYKWSKSYDRRIRMERGYESQASLYREMARNGGIQARRESELDQSVGASLGKPPVLPASIGIVYFTMRDEVCLSDSEPPGRNRVTGWHAIEGDVAEGAIGKIRNQLGQVRKGEIEMNCQGDREAFKKDWGVTAFALDLSPLVELFAAEAAARDS
ncbi:MAG: PD-(D/E)XK nuclease family protein [Bryobacterales bacterium]|nr:PD-(D/E)XK nuclease family protein [Bryobacterales bacterium]